MPTTPQTLEKIFGVTFTEQPTLAELRRYHHPNTYCCNKRGELIGVFPVKMNTPPLPSPPPGRRWSTST